jgi:hypothetical protein
MSLYPGLFLNRFMGGIMVGVNTSSSRSLGELNPRTKKRLRSPVSEARKQRATGGGRMKDFLLQFNNAHPKRKKIPTSLVVTSN